MSDARPPMPASLDVPRPAWAMMLIAGMLAAGVGGLFLGRIGAVSEGSAALEERPALNVVAAVRDLARLEGAEYHMERIIELTEKQARFFGLLESTDAILLVASGSVIAGVDLSSVARHDVTVDHARRAVELRLPSSRVIVSRLDNRRTYVHRRSTDLLAERRESLEAQARRRAESALVAAAKDAGLLEKSDESVRRTVEGLLRSLGYEVVTISFHPTTVPAQRFENAP